MIIFNFMNHYFVFFVHFEQYHCGIMMTRYMLLEKLLRYLIGGNLQE